MTTLARPLAALTAPGPRAVARAGHGDEIEDAVLARAQKGDAAACRIVVETYERRVVALIARVLAAKARPEIIEDLAQETFLRAFRALGRFRKDGSARLSTWILTIATRVTIDELRAGRVFEDIADVVEEVAVPARALAQAEERSLRRGVELVARGLPLEQRAAFVLRAFHELEYEEIAAILDVDVGTVKSRIARAREKLRQAFPEHLHGR